MAIKRMFGFASNDEVRAEQSKAAIIAKRMLPHTCERCKVMANDEVCRKRMRQGGDWQSNQDEDVLLQLPTCATAQYFFSR
jgi:hypothetical protein